MRASVLEVNVENFLFNFESIKKSLKNDTKIIPIFKANAYGTYLNNNIDILNLFDIVGVALVDEGIYLRKLGYKKEILVINQCCIDEVEEVCKYKLTASVSSEEIIEKMNQIGNNEKVHLEIETGMSRTGIQLDKLNDILNVVEKCKNIKVDGIYTHLSSADNDEEYTGYQIEIFNEAIEIIRKHELGDITYIHASASSGIINYPGLQYNTVRPGLILYGYEPFEGACQKIKLKPVCKLKSKISFIKDVNKGTSVSYGRTYITNKTTKIATIPLGYADGFKRCLSNNGFVIIDGKKCPIIGKICMDSFMADVTEIENVKVGDDVLIWDNENITIDELAKKCNTISYEILTSISSRIPRKFV